MVEKSLLIASTWLIMMNISFHLRSHVYTSLADWWMTMMTNVYEQEAGLQHGLIASLRFNDLCIKSANYIKQPRHFFPKPGQGFIKISGKNGKIRANSYTNRVLFGVKFSPFFVCLPALIRRIILAIINTFECGSPPKICMYLNANQVDLHSFKCRLEKSWRMNVN